MTGFSTFGLSEAMLKKLQAINFTTPTPIQEKSIPLAMSGKDILGTAQTGTGKTAAFGLPLVNHLINNPHSMALVMTPTRELAVQVMTQIKAFLPDGCGLRTALLIGGEAMFKQLNQLQTKPRIIIGTPGRIYDHLDRDSLRLAKADFLVLDEADRMLDMGFGVQLEAIAEYLPETRQTLMFSATVPANIMKLAQNYLKDPVRVETEAPNVAAPKIRQEQISVTDDSKHEELIKLLDSRSGQIIVFVKTKHGADRLARKLARENHSAEAIHGDLRQGQRDRVIRQFRKNETRVLVATDVAARGLDIPMLETVINYDLPQCPEDYIHRIGRTGRNGQEGEAICLIANADRAKWAAIDRLMNPDKARDRSDRRDGGSGKKRSAGGRNYGPKASFGDRKFGKPFGEKKFGGRFSDERSPRPHRGEHVHAISHEDRSERAERHMDPAYDPVLESARKDYAKKKGDGERSFGDRGANRGSSAKFGERKFGDKPFGEKKFGDKKFGEKRAGAPKEGGFKKEWSKDAPKKSWGDRDGNRDGNKKPFSRDGDKPFGEKKFGDKKFGEKREGGFKKEWSKDAPKKSWGDRDGNRDGNKKPFSRDGDKPFGEKKFGDKKFGEKKFGDKKFGDSKKSGGFKSGGFKSGGSRPFSKDGSSAPRRSRPAA